MLLTKRLIYVGLVLAAVFTNSVQAQSTRWTREGSATLEDGGYLPSALETTCDDYDLEIVRAMFKLSAEKAGLNAGLFFIQEYDKPNAYAVSNVIGTYADGSVVIGKKLFASIVTTDLKGSDAIGQDKFSALQVLIYHELAHLKQRKARSSLAGKAKELDADFRAGYWLGTVAPVMGHEASVLKILEKLARDGGDLLFSAGDYAFNEITHHGTRTERLTAFLNGFSAATKEIIDNLDAPGPLEVKADDVRFFEGARDRPPPNQRIYSREFMSAVTRQIYFELPLESTLKDKRIDFVVRHDYFSPGSMLFCSGKFSTFLAREEPKTPFYGSCLPNAGTWEKGIYTVKLYVNNNKVAESSFTIR